MCIVWNAHTCGTLTGVVLASSTTTDSETRLGCDAGGKASCDKKMTGGGGGNSSVESRIRPNGGFGETPGKF